jgi:uncharacterized protein (TIRG00374 family)
MSRATIKTLAKFLVSGTLLAYLVSRADLETIWGAVRDADWTLVAGGFLLFYMHFLIGALRWRSIARLHGADAPVRFYFVSYIVANFFNNFLPSTIGGDIVRAYDTWRAGTGKAGAAAVIFVDRAVGVLALAIIAAAGSLVLRRHEIVTVEVQVLIGLVVAGLITVVGILFRPPAWWTRLVNFAAARPSPIISKPAKVFAEIAREFRGAEGTLLLTLLLSFLLHLNIIVAYFLVGRAVGIDLEFPVYFAVIPLALVIMMLPVSINGIGLREGAFTVLLGLFGVSVSAALAFSWTFYALILLHGVLGGLVYLVRKHRPVDLADERQHP